ncbi:hypothetical protein [Plantactinospora sp. WMMB782]|uniref:hypothetical protein n=1 Tax=Plantactinospora sp. WMMB782 TaxID=3404121 RepID=UPI003B923306
MTPVDPERGTSAFRDVRGHRRQPGDLLARLWLLLILCLICCGLAGYQIAVRSLVHHVGVARGLGLAVLVLGLIVVGLFGWRLAAARLLNRWCARNGWSPAAERATWPWTAQQAQPDAVTVQFATVKTLQGLSVTVGALSWTRDGLGGSVEKSNGAGVFTVVRLPKSYPATAVQRRRIVRHRRTGEDEFLRRFRFIVDKPYFARQLADPALRVAHLTGRVPPWAIVDDELYTVVASRLPLRPTQVVTASEQALHLSRLLGVRPPESQ